MTKKNTILIADDAELNRMALKKILSATYDILEAADGRRALEILEEKQEQISAIVLDLIMPEFSGYDFMKEYHASEWYQEIPVIIATADNSPKTEQACLELGAWDFISKPYNPGIINCRVKNAIERSQLQISKELKYRAEFDVITGVYNKEKFFQATKEMLEEYPKEKYVMYSLDIEKFKIINAFFGEEEGNKLLGFLAEYLRQYAAEQEHITYGRIEGDIFCVCTSFRRKKEVNTFIESMRCLLSNYPLEFDIVIAIGIYFVEDMSQAVNEMYTKANLATRQCKGNYIKRHAYYSEEMSEEIFKEQRITNNMKHALETEQFELYLQPKYGLKENNLDGAEVLVRWMEPEKGMISPREFIPIFECNGFIMKLDYYVWNKTCELLRRWIDEGKTPLPLSVNISRVSLYNPNLVKIICGLVEKYQIPPSLLQLELTESAYTSNPKAIKEMMAEFQRQGFSVLMDDFGSGYSSLNVLKDIVVDILKIDMKFLSETEIEGRGENILASVVRMAKWLNTPVVAEGVEKREQVLFLRSIGCEFVQGYYFAKPMSVENYEKLAFAEDTSFVDKDYSCAVSTDNLWTSTSQMEILFSNMLQAVGIYEYRDGYVEIIRVNDAYYDLFGYSDVDHLQKNIKESFDAADYGKLMKMFAEVVESEGVAEFEGRRHLDNGKTIWINVKLKYVRKVGENHVIYGMITDISGQKEIDKELKKYRAAVSATEALEETILVVDDMEVNRESLAAIFEGKYRVLEASNGKEALEILEKNAYQIDIILLDLTMPVMDGIEFLKCKKENPDIEDIPVIIITAEDGTEQQIETIQMGADDYVIKPFVPEIVICRVGNVLNSKRRYGQVLRDFSHTIEEKIPNKDELDEITGLYNRYAAGKIMQHVLDNTDEMQAMLMVGMNFEDDFGTERKKQLMFAFAEILQKCFRKSDVLSHYDEDKIVILMVNTPSEEFLERRCESILEIVCLLESESRGSVRCNIGAVVTKSSGNLVSDLLHEAERALLKAETIGNYQYKISQVNGG